MSAFRLYLWKEWREHRVALLAVACILTALATGWRFLAPVRILQSSIFVSAACLVALTIGLLAVGGELLAERRAGGLAWLQRLPAGLGTPFWAKLVFLAASSFVVGLAGIALAYVTAWTRGVAQEGVAQPRLVLFLAALFALWTFAASAWSSRSVLALFSAGFVLSGLGMPIWILTTRGYRPEPWEIDVGALLLFAGALPSAWLGFFTAGRFGRGPRLAVALGFSSAVASFLPFWGWGLWQLHVRDRFDRFEVGNCFVTDDGHTAFVETVVQNERWDPEARPRMVVRVDLESAGFEPILRGNVRMNIWRLCDRDGRRADGVHVFDSNDPSVDLYFSLASGERTRLSDVTALSLCPERRGWLHTYRQSDATLADAITGKAVRPSQLSLPNDARLWNDLGRWFVISPSEGAFLLDPDSGSLIRAEWLDAVTKHFGPRLPDGRFFAPLKGGGIALVDPALAHATPLAGPDDAEYVYRAINGWSEPFAADEMVLLRTSPGRQVHLFDRATETLEPLPFLGRHRPVGATRDGAVIVVVGADLVRYDLATGAVTTLFPCPR